MSALPENRAPRFNVGDRVRIAARASLGHCRSPGYLRGVTAQIVQIQGTFRDPERLAYFRSGLPGQVLYKVRVGQSEIWPRYEGRAADDLEVDIYEHWLEPVDALAKPEA